MQVNIEVILDVEGHVVTTRGIFTVRNSDFKKDPDWTAGIIAYEWIKQMWKEYGCRNYEIVRVIWNEENDITKMVKQIRPNIQNDLPF